jgi:hypothetical protein
VPGDSNVLQQVVRRILWITWLACSIAWIGMIANQARERWPRMPLDMPRNDPAVTKALDRAVTAHVTRAATIALLPPLAGLLIGGGIGFLVSRRRQ